MTYHLRVVVLGVNMVLGYGFFEKVYEKAFMIEPGRWGLSVENQVTIKASYMGKA